MIFKMTQFDEHSHHFLSNQFYGVYEDIVTMACYAWNKLAQNVDLLKSIIYRDWINTLP